MKTLDHKLIIYDSNCQVCSFLRDVVTRFTSIPVSHIVAYKDLTPELMGQVDAVQFRNGMALVDMNGDATIYGSAGVAHIFSSQYWVANGLLQFKPIYLLFGFLYKILAYNRYIIATPKSKFQCDCFPDRIVKYRISYIIIMLLFSVLLTALFGVSLAHFFQGVPAFTAASLMLLMAGTGWVIQMVLAALLLKDKALEYVGHLGSIMVAGLLILVPWILFHAITGIHLPHLPALSVVASSAWMLYMHTRRIRHLGLSQIWTVSWLVLLQSFAAFWVYVFHLKFWI